MPATESRDTSIDVLGYEPRALDAIFSPRSVALVGASDRPGSVGRTLLHNLTAPAYGGRVHLVNPGRTTLLGRPCHASLKDLPEPVDLAVIAIPAASVQAAIRDAVACGVKGAIVVSAGFKEAGAEGAELERELVAEARRGGLRVIGPNCLGVMCPGSGLNATFASTAARKGGVAFLSQSGALCTAVLDWSLEENVGFSAFVSVGSMADVGWGDLIDYLGGQRDTSSILIYMESVGDARSFLSAAREVALTKPIIVIKPGRTEGAARAAASHTGALTGSDEVLDAAFRRSGVLRVERISDLFDLAEVLAKQPRPSGPRLAVLTNAGGPAVLATDALLEGGGELARLSPATRAALDAFLPAHWSRANPVDILGDADPERYARALDAVMGDEGADGFLVILTPQAMTEPSRTAEQLVQRCPARSKPVLASWMGAGQVAGGEAILNQHGIPTFPYPDAAARVFNYMWRYGRNLEQLYETPGEVGEDAGEEARRAEAGRVIEAARSAGRTLLSEIESKQVLAAHGIPTVETRLARGAEEAVLAAGELGYPVAVKLHSERVTHKTEVGGVQLDLADAGAVRRAFAEIERSVVAAHGADSFGGVTVQPMVRRPGYELILGSSVDAQFGPVLLFGAGGQLVEVLRDRALGLPPLNTTLARRLMERTRIHPALAGVRGRPPADLAALERLLVRFSRLVLAERWVREIDVNPLLVGPDGALALDARMVLFEASVDAASLPRPAIRPYPDRYVRRSELAGLEAVTIRPIRPEDEPAMVRFHEVLSRDTVYQRYFEDLRLDQRIAHERLTRICFLDYDREMALIGERRDPETGRGEILGIARLSRQRGGNQAEFAVLVADSWQRRGLGRALLGHLLEVASDEGMESVRGYLLPTNRGMRRLCERLGFRLEVAADLVTAEYDIGRARASRAGEVGTCTGGS